MNKTTDYIISRASILFAIPLVIYIQVLKPGTPGMIIATVVSAAVAFAWIWGGFWITRRLKKKIIDLLMQDVTRREKKPVLG